MSYYDALMSAKAWLKARDLAQEHNVSVSRVCDSILKLPLTSKTDNWIRIPRPRRARAITLPEESIELAEQKARDLHLMSLRSTSEFVGLVVEAYLFELVESAEPLVIPVPMGSGKDIYLSTPAWEGLNMQTEVSVGRAIKLLSASKIPFIWAGTPRTPEGRRRRPRRLNPSRDAISYLAAEGMRLGLVPPMGSHGAMSWASLLLEAWGLGLVRPTDSLTVAAKRAAELAVAS